jgi:hypothetical protein
MKEELVCYCFGYSADDIRKYIAENSRLLIMEKIVGEKKAGGCQCQALNAKRPLMPCWRSPGGE